MTSNTSSTFRGCWSGWGWARELAEAPAAGTGSAPRVAPLSPRSLELLEPVSRTVIHFWPRVARDEPDCWSSSGSFLGLGPVSHFGSKMALAARWLACAELCFRSNWIWSADCGIRLRKEVRTPDEGAPATADVWVLTLVTPCGDFCLSSKQPPRPFDPTVFWLEHSASSNWAAECRLDQNLWNHCVHKGFQVSGNCVATVRVLSAEKLTKTRHRWSADRPTWAPSPEKWLLYKTAASCTDWDTCRHKTAAVDHLRELRRRTPCGARVCTNRTLSPVWKPPDDTARNKIRSRKSGH